MAARGNALGEAELTKQTSWPIGKIDWQWHIDHKHHDLADNEINTARRDQECLNPDYEQILRILNDCLQGNAGGLGVLLGGTPEFLMVPRKGLSSYEALQSRLAENRFVVDGLVDFSGPVISLANLMPEDIYLLLKKIRDVYFLDQDSHQIAHDAALAAFLQHCRMHWRCLLPNPQEYHHLLLQPAGPY